MNLILLGPPGAGKGTQAKMICQKFNLCHLSTGDILRNEVSNGTDLGVLAKDVINKGQLVSDDIIIKIMKSFLNENNNKFSGFLFDGFPRSLDQANKLNDLMKSINIVIHKVILLNVDQSVLLERIIQRKEVEGRKDDNKNVLESRLDVYLTQTQPLVDYYNDLNLLKKVDGTNEINQVNQDINTILEAA